MDRREGVSGTFFLTLRAHQLELAKEIGARLLPTFEKKGIRALVTDEGVLKKVPSYPETDPVVLAVLLKQVSEQSVLQMVKGYGDWLGSVIFRALKEGVDSYPLPDCSPATRKEIGERYGVALDIVDFVIEDLHARPTELLPIGWIVDKTVRVNVSTLTKWAGYYDWGSGSPEVSR